MRCVKLLGFLLFFLLLSSPEVLSQELSSSKILMITEEQWSKLNSMQKNYEQLLTLHLRTVNSGKLWQKEMEQELLTWKSDYDKLLLDLQKEKEFSESLLSKLSSLSERLTSLQASLDKAQGTLAALELENTLLWIGCGVLVATTIAVTVYALLKK